MNYFNITNETKHACAIVQRQMDLQNLEGEVVYVKTFLESIRDELYCFTSIYMFTDEGEFNEVNNPNYIWMDHLHIKINEFDQKLIVGSDYNFSGIVARYNHRLDTISYSLVQCVLK